MAEPDPATELRKLAEPLMQACDLAERHGDFILAAKLSDCIEWIASARYDPMRDHDSSL